MLNPRKFERINGHEVEVAKQEGGDMFEAYCVCDCDGGPPCGCMTIAATPELSLAMLLTSVFKLHSRIVLKRAGWKCSNCSRVTGLAVHHVVFKSHGRNDRIENLRALCAACHSAEHGIKCRG
jgi:HNH endonuclease